MCCWRSAATPSCQLKCIRSALQRRRPRQLVARAATADTPVAVKEHLRLVDLAVVDLAVVDLAVVDLAVVDLEEAADSAGQAASAHQGAARAADLEVEVLEAAALAVVDLAAA